MTYNSPESPVFVRRNTIAEYHIIGYNQCLFTLFGEENVFRIIESEFYMQKVISILRPIIV